MKISTITLCTAVAMAGVAVTGCNNPSTTKTDSKAETATKNTTSDTVTTGSSDSNTMAGKTIRVATEGSYKPFNLTKPDGTLGGFDVELMNALCDDMQAKCDIKPQDWDGLLPGLMAKKYDVVIDAMSITPDRQAQVDFTESYFTKTLVFVTKKDSPLNPDDPAQIDSHKVAAQRSTLSSQWMEKNHPKTQLNLYETIDNAFMDLASGRSDMMISDKAPAYDWLKSKDGQNFEIKGKEIDVNDKMPLPVRTGAPLAGQLSLALSHIKANGTYDKILQANFGDMMTPTSVTTSGATTTTVAPSAKAESTVSKPVS